jgi:hypothetical protein
MVALDPGTITMIQRVGFLDLEIWFVSVGIRAILDCSSSHRNGR